MEGAISPIGEPSIDTASTSPNTFEQRWPRVAEAGLTCLFAVAQDEPPATAYVPDIARAQLAKGPAEAFQHFCKSFDCSPLWDRAFLKELLGILKYCDYVRRVCGFEVGSVIAQLADIQQPQRRRVANATAQMRALELAVDFYRSLVAERPEAARDCTLPTSWPRKMEALLLLRRAGIGPRDAWESWWEKIPQPVENEKDDMLCERLLGIEAALLAVTGLSVAEPPICATSP